MRTLMIPCVLWISACSSLASSTAAAAPAKPPRIDPAALSALERRARATESTSVVIYRDGALVAEWPVGQHAAPIEAMSATKSVVSLAIGRLIDTRKLTSIDQPVCELFPEWRQGRKQQITIRHLLEHTSGLQNVPNTGVEIYPSADFVKLALAAEVIDEPGKVFSYNNKAVNLLAGVVKVASGKPLDDYVRDEIFTPLGITELGWTRDGAGNPHAMSGLQIKAHDFAKIGQMMLDGGVWKGKRILSAEWIADSTRPSATQLDHGHLWWIEREFRAVLDNEAVAQWRASGVDADVIARLLPLVDRVFTDYKAYLDAIDKAIGLERWMELRRQGIAGSKPLPSPTLGFSARGYLGQYLVVIPSSRIVAVRLRETMDEAKANNQDLGFVEFADMVRALVPAK